MPASGSPMLTVGSQPASINSTTSHPVRFIVVDLLEKFIVRGELWAAAESVTRSDTWLSVRFVLFTLVALPAWGASVALRYEAPDGCPDESALRQLVAARLGVDPFLPEAPAVVTVKVLSGSPLQAEVALESPGAPIRKKTLTGKDCTELMQSVAVTVALVVDPVLKRAEPAPEPVVVEKKPEPSLPPPAQPASAPVQPTPEPLHWALSVGGSANLGQGITAQPNLRLETRLRFAALVSLGLEGRIAFPVTGSLTQGQLTTSAMLGAVVPCLHFKWLAGCADFTAGALRLEGQALASARAASVFHAAVGLRLIFSVPLTEHFAVGAMLEGQVPLTRATALVGNERVWTVPPVGGGLGFWVSLVL